MRLFSHATAIAEALKGRRVGQGYMCPCPAHHDSTPSLAVDETAEGRIVFYCHAGCSQANVISCLKALGLWPPRSHATSSTTFDERAPDQGATRQDAKQRTANAVNIWCNASEASGTIVESYLRARSITVPIPRRLRHRPALRHTAGVILPAMVGLVTAGVDDRPLGVHRTWLDQTGEAKASISPNKMLLGPCKGGAVRLSRSGQPLLVGEGIETCLSAMQATGLPAWAALSTSGLKSLVLPNDILEIIILADADRSGDAAAQRAARRWTREGRSVRIARPPEGEDFNDLLKGKYATQHR